LLFYQVDEGLKNLLEWCAGRDALEHAALAFKQSGAQARAQDISRHFPSSDVHFLRIGRTIKPRSTVPHATSELIAVCITTEIFPVIRQ
jgi:hypothetical protein